MHEPTGRHAPASSAPVEIADAAPERPVRVLVADDLADHRPGDKVTITVEKTDGTRRTTTVTLGELPGG